MGNGGGALAPPGNVVKCLVHYQLQWTTYLCIFSQFFGGSVWFIYYFWPVFLRVTTKKCGQLFQRKKCTPEKILATPMNLKIRIPLKVTTFYYSTFWPSDQVSQFLPLITLPLFTRHYTIHTFLRKILNNITRTCIIFVTMKFKDTQSHI